MNDMKKLLKLMTLTVAIMLTGSLHAFAQDNMSGNTDKKDKKNNSQTAMPSAADTEFANMAAAGGQAEIQMAELAVQKSTNKDVQKYAKRMIKDHAKAGKNLDKIAAKKNMTLSKMPTEEQKQMMTQLQQASGADFDRMYIQMAGVQAHEKMETLFQNEANNGSDKDLKAFAAKTLPVVQMHLTMAREMAQGGTAMKNHSMK